MGLVLLIAWKIPVFLDEFANFASLMKPRLPKQVQSGLCSYSPLHKICPQNRISLPTVHVRRPDSQHPLHPRCRRKHIQGHFKETDSQDLLRLWELSLY